jgi:hypothetical protein
MIQNENQHRDLTIEGSVIDDHLVVTLIPSSTSCCPGHDEMFTGLQPLAIWTLSWSTTPTVAVRA